MSAPVGSAGGGPPPRGSRTGVPLRQAPQLGEGSTASSLAPTARPLVANSRAQIVVVLIHGLNSSPSAFIGSDGTSWATEINETITPLIGNRQVEVAEVGWQTTPTSPANVSLTITSTTPELLDSIARLVGNRQWVAVGHSMGGMEILAALGVAFAETSQPTGNPVASDAQRLQAWATLLDTCLGIFRLASPGQGSPWGRFGLAVATVVPHANPAQIRGLAINAQEQRQITESSEAWFRSRKDAQRVVNIVDFDGSAFAKSSEDLTNSKTVKLPGESHTSAPKAPAGSATGNTLVAGVVFCITGNVPEGTELTPGTSQPSSKFRTIAKRLMPSKKTFSKLLPGKRGNSSTGQGPQPGAGGSVPGGGL
ncbi:hypothetical protein PV04_06287 [Phialophora macrospora]|uniref:Uncharacterized protein n=1 Tax=Phialophora macrospora TaxID=1851006 RepID=A0A0D2G4T4_9EURO|nr:hypothetical protein PV04_06287 [Phialophora macrospora]